MHGRIGRRAFLHGAGCAACAAALGWHLPRAGAQDARAFEHLDRQERLRLADLAVAEAGTTLSVPALLVKDFTFSSISPAV